MKIPMTDLKAQYESIRPEIDEAISGVVREGRFILGPDVKALEDEMAAYLGVRYAVGVASGTEALLLALIGLGIKPGDEVITSPFTFIATAEAITQCGATPVFADIDPKTYNINADEIEPSISEKTRAILPVHLYGQAAAMEPVLYLAEKYNLRIIEDCAQALGAEYRGRKAGSLGDAGCLSFFPSKILGAYGDGGMIVTSNPELAEGLFMLRNHGCRDKSYHITPGFNSRLDSLQAAILRTKMKHIDNWIGRRQKNAESYARFLSGIEGIELPCTAPGNSHAYNYYTIRLDTSRIDRDELREHLNFRGIATSVYYPLSLHLQGVYQPLGYQTGDLPESETAQEQVLSLPMYPELTVTQIEYIAGVIKDYCRSQVSVPAGN